VYGQYRLGKQLEGVCYLIRYDLITDRGLKEELRAQRLEEVKQEHRKHHSPLRCEFADVIHWPGLISLASPGAAIGGFGRVLSSLAGRAQPSPP
jgi:hypothetical protein